MPTEGYVYGQRIVYSIQYALKTDPPCSRSLIVNLDSDGNSIGNHCRPADPTKRIIQVRPGDDIVHGGKIFTVISVKAYRGARRVPSQA